MKGEGREKENGKKESNEVKRRMERRKGKGGKRRMETENAAELKDRKGTKGKGIKKEEKMG